MNTQNDENTPTQSPDMRADGTDDAEKPSLDNTDLTATIDAATHPATLISLGGYRDVDYLTKKELCAVFKCGSRTVQRMVERFEIPPPMWLAGRKVWIVGNLRAWIADAAKRNDAEALQVAKKMRIFND